MPPFSFSAPAASVALFLTLLVSDVANSNTGRILVQALPDLDVEDVGNGACRDDQNRSYDYIRFKDDEEGAVVESIDDCERLCVACTCEVSVNNPNRQFRGFAYVTDGSQPQRCVCYFDNDSSANFSNECQNMDAGRGSLESASLYESGRTGSGPIDGSSGSPNTADCWRTVTTFSTEDCPSDMPSGSPSIVPSDSPSVTPSESPSDAPSIVPSESPSDAPSIVPSESPSDTPSESTSPTAKASKRPRGPKSSKMPKASTGLQVQEMKSGGSPSLSSLTIVGVCGTFAIITFMFVDLI